MTENEKIVHVLEAIMPAFTKSFRIKLDDDATGQPAVWVWAIIADDVLNSSTLEKDMETFRLKVGETLRANEIKRWPYVRVEAVSDQAKKP